MGLAVVGLMVASAAIQAYAARQQAQAEAQQAKANQQISEAQTADSLQRGAEAAGEARSQGSEVLGAQRAAAATGNVDLSVGGARNLFDSTQTDSEYDAGIARSNATREAWGHQVETQGYKMQRQLAQRRTVLGPLAAGVGGLAQVTSYQYQRRRA